VIRRLAGFGLPLALLVLSLPPAGGIARAGTAPRHGGILEFAVDAEPPNYDCHANISFAFIHSVAPQYSTLLKFSTADYPDVKGDLAQSWTVSPDRTTYTFKLRPHILFHDGSPLTARDVAASYHRIIDPPPGVVSVRRADYAAIASIETPDETTVVFRLRWPDSSMLSNFASPWNCIYSADKLQVDPKFPDTHVMGSGPFVFVEHVKGDHWSGRRWDRYYRPGLPYLDGFRADYVRGDAAIKGLESGRVLAGFRSVTPQQRDALVNAMGDKAVVYSSPWNVALLLTFNSRMPPFNDQRVREALSLAIDRWDAANALAGTSFLKFVGGIMRPGSEMSASETELTQLPGFSHDIAASRAEARRLLAAAGQSNLHLTITNRSDVPIPFSAGGELLVASWAKIGVIAKVDSMPTKQWQADLEAGHFQAALDFVSEPVDDPTLTLAHYISPGLSPLNHSGATDPFLDALFVGQAVTADPRQRLQIIRQFEREALAQADNVPLLWWNRIVVLSRRVHGWHITPSSFIGQDLADVWLEP